MTMHDNKLPKGWNEAKLRWVLVHYEKQTEDEAVIEDEAGVAASEADVNLPRDPV